MKIKKYTKLKGNKYSILLDDITITLYDDVIVKYELLRKKEIDDKLFEEITTYNDKLEAYYKALKYITKKLRTEKEVFDYLDKEYRKSVIKETIERLKKEGYLNEEFYLKCYINDKINLSNDGPNKIKKDLIKLGLDEEMIIVYLEEINDEIWLDKIEKIIKKRMNSNKNYGVNKLKEKLIYDLGNLGYYKWMCDEKLNDITFKPDDDILLKEYFKIYNSLVKKYEGKELKLKIINKLLTKGFNYADIKNIVERDI